ncbi:MAG: N-acyl-D-amino-acid deacylase family protein [Ignavibacteriales bacterium]
MLITGGKVFDGSGNPWVAQDIGIKDGVIHVVPHGSAPSAVEVIEASGRMVCPGFIDMHSHSDLMLFAEPESRLKVLQGVTTEVLGQDGIGPAPISRGNAKQWERFLSGLAGTVERDWDWESLGDYLSALERARPSVNVLSYLPQGNVRLEVLGLERKTPGPADMERMRKMIRRGMEDGAFGMSVGLIYLPCFYSSEQELIELYSEVARAGGIMVVHMRNEGDFLIEAIEEVMRIAGSSGTPLHISHFKSVGRPNWPKYPRALEMIEEARARGLDVTFDQYPYIAASTFLMALLPPWALEGGVDRTVERLRDASTRAKISHQIENGMDDPAAQRASGWDNYARLAGWDGVLVTSVESRENARFQGKTVTEIAVARGVDPASAVFDLLVEERCAVGMAVFMMSEDNVALGMKSPYHTVGTDGLLAGKPHPRAGGSYPRILGRYVRDSKVLTLQEAIRRMTHAPAMRLGLKSRGLIRDGMAADIVVFNPETVLDLNSFDSPRTPPAGIDWVLVNGVVVVRNGKHTGQRPGRVLRKGAD